MFCSFFYRIPILSKSKVQIWLGFFPAFFVLISLQPIEDAYSDVRRDRFTSRSKPRQFAALGVDYKSDQNSNEYKISAKYEYKNNRLMNEFNLLRNVIKAETKTTPMRKTKDLYDIELSGKVLMISGDNYFNYYNRTKYDELSVYYRDVTTAVGFGRLFFNRNIELALNLGWNDVKKYDSDFVINPTIQVAFDLTDKIRFTSKGFLFKRGVNFDGIKNHNEQLRSNLSFRFDNNIYFEMVHLYEKNRYIAVSKKSRDRVTDVSRSYLARIKYEF